jgi:hypothetical protein
MIFDVKYERLINRFIKEYGLHVTDGPFAGMQYIPYSNTSMYLAKLIGSYEEELHAVWTGHVFNQDYDAIVNIGAGDGYYAVGLGMKFPHNVIYVFEADPQARKCCEQLAEANQIANRFIHFGQCNPYLLNQLTIYKRGLIIWRMAGEELQLLQPQLLKELALWDIIVDLPPEPAAPNSTEILIQRFESTHEPIIIPPMERDSFRYPLLAIFNEREKAAALNEDREASWMFLKHL